LRNNKNNGSASVTLSSSTKDYPRYFVGGLVGHLSSKNCDVVDDNSNNGFIEGSILKGYIYTGGVIGYVESVANASFRGNKNNATINIILAIEIDPKTTPAIAKDINLS